MINFIEGVNANRRLRIYSNQLDKEILASFQGQPRSELPNLLAGLVNIEDRRQELPPGRSLRKLLNKRAQNDLGISATILGSIAVEVNLESCKGTSQ